MNLDLVPHWKPVHIGRVIDVSGLAGESGAAGRPPPSHVALALLAPGVVIGWLVLNVRYSSIASDFHDAYLRGARDILSGASPYHFDELASRHSFVYPPLTAFLAIPLAPLPPAVANWIVVVLTIVALGSTLRLLDVRDWRCYALAGMWLPTLSELQTGNAVMLVVVGSAALWRYRDRQNLAGILTGAVVAIKLLAWPLLFFLVITGRRGAAVVGCVSLAAFILLPWAVIRFTGLASYPHLLTTLARYERSDAYTIGALIGPRTSWAIAQAVTCSVGAVIFGYAISRREDDRRVFILALGAAVLMATIVWLDDFTLLLIPIALVSQRFSVLWLAPLVFYGTTPIYNGTTWQTSLGLLLTGVIFAVATWAPSGSGRASRFLSGETA